MSESLEAVVADLAKRLERVERMLEVDEAPSLEQQHRAWAARLQEEDRKEL